MKPSHPKPNVDEDNRAFWEAVYERRFVLMRCDVCGTWYWPAAYCRNHANKPFSGSLHWEEASGTGKVFAFNVHHKAFHPAFSDKVPYVFALIELTEGPMFGTNIIECAPQDVYIGMPVNVVFSEEAEGVILPLFRPVALAQAAVQFAG
jgi:uncharacterized OB-fold protein